jgi:hypothetical protein
MRLTLVTLLALGLSASVLMAQDVPKAEAFAGYSYLNVDTNGLSSRQSLNGWEASVSGNFNKWFAVEFDGSGYYKTVLGVNVRDYSYLAGPRINFGPLFVHGLLGGDHLTGSYQGLGASQDGFAGAFGGGVQWKIARQLYFRTSTDYVFSRHNILGGPSVTQNNFRASVGIVFAFGGTRREVHAGNRSVPSPVPGSSEAALLGASGYPVQHGFEITSVRPGSPAAQAGLQVRDVIEKIDGQSVTTSQDIERAVAASKSGTVRVSYLVQGNWLAEREIKVR